MLEVFEHIHDLANQRENDASIALADESPTHSNDGLNVDPLAISLAAAMMMFTGYLPKSTWILNSN